MNQSNDTTVLNTLDQTSVKSFCYKDKLIIEGDIATLTSSKSNRFGIYFLKLLVYAFWISIPINLYHSNFLLFDKAPIVASVLLTLLFYGMGLIMTITSCINSSGVKEKEFLNKKTRKIKLYGLKKKNQFKFNEITGLQLISYIKKQRVSNPKGASSYTVTHTIYEINLVVNNNKRFKIITVSDRETAITYLQQLSEFTEKPYTLHIEATDSESENKRAEKEVKNRLIITADLTTTPINIDAFIKNPPFEVKRTATNQYTILTDDYPLEFFFSEKKLGKIKAHMQLRPTSNSSTKKVKIRTPFRYDMLIYILFIPLPMFFTENIFLFILLTFLSAAMLFRIFFLKTSESQFVKDIITALLPKEEY